MTLLLAYDRARVHALLRDTTPHDLLHGLAHGTDNLALSADDHATLEALLRAWEQRALGAVPLRDALLVDPLRGQQVYTLLCRAAVVEQCRLPATHAAALPALPIEQPAALAALADSLPPAGAALLALADERGLAVRLVEDTHDPYPLPDRDTLHALLPPLPTRYDVPPVLFQQPGGWRRALAILLASVGVALLGVPLLLGHWPGQAAGLPLGLLTLALLVGIRAAWMGYLGSFCIWLVPNLPGFHHSTTFSLLPNLALLLGGLLLLGCDRHVRALWRWLRWRWLPAGSARR